MKRDITLYVGSPEKRADLDDKSFILFTWANTDVTEVAQVKNGHSCTVTLPGTPVNDGIFGQMQRNDRATVFDVPTNGVCFDPSRRTPFTVYDDSGGILEAGYLKLDEVVTEGAKHSYRVTLFGGLGSFLYSLTYDSQGNRRTLADLDYKAHGSNVPVDLSFTIDAATVKTAWDRLAVADQYDWPAQKWDILNFAPAYNGAPRGAFSPDKGLYPSGGFLPADVDGHVPAVSSGEVLVTMPTKKTEWETRDLRSYLQRPVLRVAALLDAVCDPANNGGYTVDTSDADFDPSYGGVQGSWITLPLLQDLTLDTNEYYDTFAVATDQSLVTLPAEGTPGFPTKYQLKFVPRFYISGAQPLTLYDTSYSSGSLLYLNVLRIYVRFFKNGNMNGGKTIYASSEPVGTLVEDRWAPANIAGKKTTHWGYFQGASGQGNWEGDPLVVEFTDEDADKVRVYVSYEASAINYSDPSNPVTPYADVVWESGTSNRLSVTSVSTTGYGTAAGNLTTKSRSFATVTKAQLLSTDYTPADYLLSLCKMMNVRMYADPVTGVVHFVADYKFLSGTAVDLTKRINRGKPITKTPLQFSARWYEWRSKYDHGEYAQYYANVYGRTYGCHRVNTGYEFDANTLEVVDTVLFRGAVQILEPSQYYVDANAGGYDIPAVFLEAGATYQLVNAEGDAVNAPVPSTATAVRQYVNATHPYYDLFDKAQFHDADNAGYDERDTLLYFGGMQDVTDRGYILTDDTAVMMQLNNDTPCWHLSRPASGVSYALTAIPQFTRFDGDGTLDYGVPASIPVPDLDPDDIYGVYELFWQDYVQAHFSVDAPVLRCWVNWDGMQVGPDLLRRRYEFDGARWQLNKIINYSLTTWDDTECEFLKLK